MADNSRTPKKNAEDNLWNQILAESRTSNKFPDCTVIILGDKHSGKRTLLNALMEISETDMPNKSNIKMRRKSRRRRRKLIKKK